MEQQDYNNFEKKNLKLTKVKIIEKLYDKNIICNNLCTKLSQEEFNNCVLNDRIKSYKDCIDEKDNEIVILKKHNKTLKTIIINLCIVLIVAIIL